MSSASSEGRNAASGTAICSSTWSAATSTSVSLIAVISLSICCVTSLRLRGRTVELVGHEVLGVGLVVAGPPDRQLAQRGHLLEGHRALAEELEQREEAGPGRQPVRRVAAQRAERHRPGAPEPFDDQRRLLPDA